MIHVSRSPEFSNCGSMNSVCTPVEQEMSSFSANRGRQRSHSYYSPEDCRNYGVQIQKEETCLRPRSRYGDTSIFLHCDCKLLSSVIPIMDQIYWQQKNVFWSNSSKGHFTVLRHRSFTLAMTQTRWYRTQLPCNRTKWTKRRRKRETEILFVLLRKRRHQTKSFYQENLMVRFCHDHLCVFLWMIIIIIIILIYFMYF